jgi:general nucleoside transport system ATP-binding protein
MTALLTLHETTKSYGPVRANDRVSLILNAGEVHALLGENGAGKSTLVKTICGLVQPDSGAISWRGQPITLPGPAAARALGIGVVFQHFSLFEALTVTENIALGLDGGHANADLTERIDQLSTKYGLTLNTNAIVGDLSVGERQRVEIVRALMQDPALLVLDEPTSVLTPQEVGSLATTLRQLADEGRGILYISHKLSEIRNLCDRVTVLRGGKIVADADPKTTSPEALAELMVGQRLPQPKRVSRLSPDASARLVPDASARLVPDASARLVIDHLSQAPNPFSPTGLHNVSLSVQAGEVLGIAGVAGNGQNALLAALSGEVLAGSAGTITLDDQPIGHIHPQGRRTRGLAYVPPERLGTGAVPELDLTDNALLSTYRRLAFAVRGLLQPGKVSHFANSVVDRFDVRSAGISALASSLSGGNLQKFIVGREIMQTPKLLVAAHPTWGVDAGAAAAIHQALLDLATEGASIIIVSEDLDELLMLADRIAVLCDGRLSVPIPVAQADATTLGMLMAGEPVDAAA